MSLWIIGLLWLLSLIVVGSLSYRLGVRRVPPAPPPPPVTPMAPRVFEVEAPVVTDPRWSEVAGRVAFQDACQSGLARSIIGNLRSTTDPMTQSLSTIRTELVELVSKVRTHDQRMSSGEDLAWVESLGTTVKQDMTEAARLTQSIHDDFSHHIGSLKRALENILNISVQIEDLSQRINVLSINASIEAARAGLAGRGFKVIAGEVKTLALESSSFLGQIAATVSTTQKLFQGIGSDLEAKRSSISGLLVRQAKSFDSFRQAFAGQRAEFESLYRAIVEFTNRLDVQITGVSPMIQLHDIAVQELENLNLVVGDSARALLSLAAADTFPHPSAHDVETWAREARVRLTTASELRVLDTVLDQYGIKPRSALQQRPGALEIF